MDWKGLQLSMRLYASEVKLKDAIEKYRLRGTYKDDD
jgi:hypothetical protein